jgi:HAD superfamily hydrolase (TIGR01509 family)
MRIAGNEIEVIGLDLFGVLISFDDDLVVERLARHCDDPDGAYRRLHKLTARPDIITARASLARVHQHVVEAEGLKLSYAEFEAAWLEPYSEAIPGMAELVETLSRHYRLVLLSNIDRDYWRVVRALHPELDRFESLLVSCDLGMAKPDPEIYRHVSRLTSVEPARCLFVDDTARNVDAAREIGFHGHTFRGVVEFREELRQAGAEGV